MCDKLIAAIPYGSVAVLVESSQRADPLIRERFNQREVARGGKEIPIDYCFMPKAANVAGLVNCCTASSAMVDGTPEAEPVRDHASICSCMSQTCPALEPWAI